MVVNSPVENLDMFRHALLWRTRGLGAGVGKLAFLSSVQAGYPHVEKGKAVDGRNSMERGAVGKFARSWL
jgi:hypothetical protein